MKTKSSRALGGVKTLILIAALIPLPGRCAVLTRTIEHEWYFHGRDGRVGFFEVHRSNGSAEQFTTSFVWKDRVVMSAPFRTTTLALFSGAFVLTTLTAIALVSRKKKPKQ